MWMPGLMMKKSSNSSVCRASSRVISSSCSFSPGRMPTISCSQSGRDRLRQIDDAHRRNFRHENLAAA